MLQESFMKIFKSLNQFSYQGSFEGWMKRITVNVSINYAKKYNNFNAPVDFVIESKLVSAEKRSGLSTQSYNALDKLYSDDLLKVVQQLSPVYKVVFNLSVIEGYSHAEIAQMLDITESTSRSNLAKAKSKLVEMIGSKKQTVAA